MLKCSTGERASAVRAGSRLAVVSLAVMIGGCSWLDAIFDVPVRPATTAGFLPDAAEASQLPADLKVEDSLSGRGEVTVTALGKLPEGATENQAENLSRTPKATYTPIPIDPEPASGTETTELAALTAGGEVSDTELAGMRGGWNFGGVEIDFGIFVRTVVDGAITNQYSWGSGSVTPLDHSQLQQIITNGGGNEYFFDPGSFEGVSTLIQNTADNTVIQHLSAISIEVHNYQATVSQTNLINSLNWAITGGGL